MLRTLPLVLLLAGCPPRQPDPPPTTPPADKVTPTPPPAESMPSGRTAPPIEPPDVSSPPGSWTCATAPLPGTDEAKPMVLRAAGIPANGSLSLMLQPGPLHGPTGTQEVRLPHTLTLPSGATEVTTPLTYKDASVDLHCWTVHAAQTYRYDGATGTCTRADGAQGRNAWSIIRLRETRDAECADLTGLDLGEGDLSYPTLSWNGRGALFTDTQLVFAIWNGPLEGADLSGISYGYATIKGSTDAHTRRPAQGCRSRTGPLECSL